MKDWKKAGKIANEALLYGKRLIEEDSSVFEVVEKVEKKIFDLGGKPAFPAQVSINEMAAHFTPIKDDLKFKKNDVVKLDVGAHINGAIGDNALTVDLGDNKELLKASEEALKQAIKVVQIGTQLREIGKTIDETISGYGFKPIKNLSGHSIDIYEQHSGTTIPNYDDGNDTELEDGMIIAIEPFATDGVGKIEEGKESGIYKMQSVKNVRNQMTREILDYIVREYKTLPFTSRWLYRKFPEFKVNFALKILERDGIIYGYKQLPEKGKGIVSQFEHTLLVNDKVEILTKQ